VKKYFVIDFPLVILAMRLLSFALTLVQDTSTVLRPDPSSLGLAPEALGTVAIVGENVQDLYGLEFHLTFDPNIVEVVDADTVHEGIQIIPADWWADGFVAVNRADNINGRIDFAATLLGSASPIYGDQVIVAITFAAKKMGISALSIESAILSTRDAEVIFYEKYDGLIGVNPEGRAPDVNTTIESTGSSFSAVSTGRLALAGLAVIVFLVSVCVFVFVLRRKR